MKSNNRRRIITPNNYFDNNINTLIFIMLIVGIIPSAISGYIGENMWIKYIMIISSWIFNTIYLILLIIISYNITKRFNSDAQFFLRYLDYKKLILNNVKKMLYILIYSFITALILILSASIVFSFGNYKNVIYPQNNSLVLYYLPIIILKQLSIYTQSSITLYLSAQMHNYKITLLFTIILLIIVYINPIFDNLYKDILFIVIINIILSIINYIIYKMITNKKRDLL